MKLNPYSNTHESASIGFFPLLATLLLLTLHYFSGALDWPQHGDIRAQRDFNSALGMSLITGYFWFALRLMHQNVASTLISLLVKTNQLSQFSFHRSALFLRLKHQSMNCIIVALMLTLVYVFVEGLLFNSPAFHQYVLAVNGTMFWFFFCLFLAQISLNINYLRNEILVETEQKLDLLNSISALIKLGFVNATTALGAFALFPIFWFEKAVPIIDIIGASVFALIIISYLFLPIVKLRKQWFSVKNEVHVELYANQEKLFCEQNEDLTKLDYLQSERELLIKMAMLKITTQDKVRLGACITTVLLSWFIFGFFSYV
jgi:hypothetical protein